MKTKKFCSARCRDLAHAETNKKKMEQKRKKIEEEMMELDELILTHRDLMLKLQRIRRNIIKKNNLWGMIYHKDFMPRSDIGKYTVGTHGRSSKRW